MVSLASTLPGLQTKLLDRFVEAKLSSLTTKLLITHKLRLTVAVYYFCGIFKLALTDPEGNKKQVSCETCNTKIVIL